MTKLSQEKLNSFKESFLSQKEELLKNLSKEYLDEQTQGADEVDIAQSLVINAMIEQQTQREKKLVFSITEALQRIEDDTFGICKECEEPISEKRIEAVPLCKLCIHCAEYKEKRAKKYINGLNM